MLKQYLGAAVGQALAAGLTSSGMSFTTSDSTGMPSGGPAPFVVSVEKGTPQEEKILVASRSGNTYTVATSGRGYDGTIAIAHLSGAPVNHVIDAVSLQETNAHVNDTSRDDHTQYLNQARHDQTSRHTYGAGLLAPSTPAAVGTAANAGSGDAPARGNHVHVIGTGAINDPAMFANGVIAAAAIAALVIPHGIVICTSGTRPGTATQGDLILETDTHRVYLYDNSVWNYIYGGTDPTGLRAHLAAGTTIPANSNTKITFDTEDWDHGNNFATGTYTVPTAGIYHITSRVSVAYNQNPQGFGISIYVNGSAYSSGTALTERNMNTNDQYAMLVHDSIKLAAGDTVEIWVFNGAASNAIGVGGGGSAGCFVSVVRN